MEGAGGEDLLVYCSPWSESASVKELVALARGKNVGVVGLMGR